MRKIEQTMLNALNLKKDLMTGNTRVFYMDNTGNPNGDRSAVYLHNNHIADYWHVSGELEINLHTLKEWPSNTTKSRLRALGANVTTKNHVTYYNGTAV